MAAGLGVSTDAAVGKTQADIQRAGGPFPSVVRGEFIVLCGSQNGSAALPGKLAGIRLCKCGKML